MAHSLRRHCFPHQHEVSTIREALLSWFDHSKRAMPWRDVAPQPIVHSDLNQRAYEVLVSEIMLQQTQVATVIAYYEKWMDPAKFPTVQSLAAASIDEVNAVWAGLGYYRRAKYLHDSAKYIMSTCEGQFPTTAATLRALPGVGDYTSAAISSIVFGERIPVVDGNVIRLLARLQGITASADSPQLIAHVRQLAMQLVDCERPGDLNQALMELGATHCRNKQSPSCDACPLQQGCQAWQRVQSAATVHAVAAVEDPDRSPPQKHLPEAGAIEDCCHLCTTPYLEDIPGDEVFKLVPGSKKVLQRRKEAVAKMLCQRQGDGKILIRKRDPKAGLLAGMWEIPTIVLPATENTEKSEESEKSENTQTEALEPARDESQPRWLSLWASEALVEWTEPPASMDLGTFRHLFSHVEWTVHVIHLTHVMATTQTLDLTQYQWVDASALDTQGLSKTCLQALKLWKKQGDASKKGSRIREGEKTKTPKIKSKKIKMEEMESVSRTQPTIMQYFESHTVKKEE